MSDVFFLSGQAPIIIYEVKQALSNIKSEIARQSAKPIRDDTLYYSHLTPLKDPKHDQFYCQ